MSENVYTNQKLTKGVFDWVVASAIVRKHNIHVVDFKPHRGQTTMVFYFDDTPEFREAYERETEIAKERREARRKAEEEALKASNIELA